MDLYQSPQAISDCTKIVLDDGRLFGTALSRVESGAQNMMRTTGNGLVLRVVVAPDTQAGVVSIPELPLSTNGYMQRIIGQCPSWRALDGTLNDKMIVILIGVKDHLLGIHVGGFWSPRITKPVADGIAGNMSPYFAQGDFAGGMNYAYNQLSTYTVKQINAPAVTNPGVSQPITVVNQAPKDNSFGWGLLGFLMLVAVAGVGAWYLWKRASTGSARRAAMEAKSLVEGYVFDLQERPELLTSRLGRLEGKVSGSDLLTVIGWLKSAKALTSEVYTDYEGMRFTANPDNKGLNQGDYQRIEAAYRGLHSRAKQAQSSLQSVENQIELWEENPGAQISQQRQPALPEVEESPIYETIPAPAPYRVTHPREVIIEEVQERPRRHRRYEEPAREVIHTHTTEYVPGPVIVAPIGDLSPRRHRDDDSGGYATPTPPAQVQEDVSSITSWAQPAADSSGNASWASAAQDTSGNASWAPAPDPSPAQSYTPDPTPPAQDTSSSASFAMPDPSPPADTSGGSTW